jgi:hypothetical protein
MKTALLLIVLLTIFSSCSKEEPLSDFDFFWSQFQGDAAALINGSPAKQNNYQLWVRANLYKANDWDSAMGGLLFIRTTPLKEQRETFSIGPLPLYKTGRFKINQSTDRSNIAPSNKTLISTMTVMEADGDAILGWYNIVPSEDNYITITHFDKDQIRGTFQATYAKAEPFLLGPDTIRITDGTFSSKIILGKELQ